MLIDARTPAAVGERGSIASFAERALDVAIALTRASAGAVFLLPSEDLEPLASRLDVDGRARARALVSAFALAGVAGSSIQGAVVPFGGNDGVAGVVYLEGMDVRSEARVRHAQKVAELLAKHCTGEFAREAVGASLTPVDGLPKRMQREEQPERATSSGGDGRLGSMAESSHS